MSFFLGQILDKMASRDKDIRFMATHDLAAELEKESFKMDPTFEPKIVTKLLSLTSDNANNVQENVVKCLGLLIKRVKDAQAIEMVDSLSKGMVDNTKEELQEISSIGLKSIISNLPSESSAISNLVIKSLVPKLISAIDANIPNEKAEVKMSSLDILNDLLVKYGSSMTGDLENIQKVVLPKLNASRPAIRKRAILCLSSMAAPAPDALFNQLIEFIIKSIEESKKPDHTSTLIQAIGAICKTSGYRLGKYLSKIMPNVIKYCDKADQNDELRENCLLCFEALVEKCQKDISPYLQDIINLCCKFIKYDPNYSDDMDEEEEEMDTDEQEEEDEDEEADISDDDDISWKIRRSSAKTLCAIILTRVELIQELFEKVAPVLYQRFKEREENVRLDIFQTFSLLLKQLYRKNVSPEAKQILLQQIPKLVSSISKSLSDKSIRIKVGAFSLLKELVTVCPSCLEKNVGQLVSGINLSLGEKNANSNLKIEVLIFLKLLLSNHPAEIFRDHYQSLSTHIIKCINDSYYRISSEALRVCQEFINVLSPLVRPSGNLSATTPLLQSLYQAIYQQLEKQDIDQEVKESAISCMGTLIANFGDAFPKETLKPCLAILLERLDNEITRVVTVKVLSRIITSQVCKTDVSAILEPSIDLMATFLRKNNRVLKQSSLVALIDIVRQIPGSISAKQLPTILVEVSSLINEADLQLTHLAFVFYQELLKSNPKCASTIKDKYIPPTLLLLKSSLLQGVALDSLLTLFGIIVEINEPGMTYQDLLQLLIDCASQIKQPVTRQAFLSISQCIAIITVHTTSDKRQQTINTLLGNLTGNNESLVLLSLSCIGEIGRRIDISATSAQLQSSVYKTFDAANEEIKQVAALCLGDIAVCSLQSYLPFILEQIKNQPKKQYLLLHSLRETIIKLSSTSQGITAILPYLQTILPILFENCVNEEEGTRNIVAECLGKVSMISPKDIIPKLQEKIKSTSNLERSTIVTSIKFSILESKDLVDQFLAPHISDFLTLLLDTDLIVKRSALLTLNYISHNKAGLIRNNLSNYLPILYNNSKIKPELIREVDLGPFKHKVDDGIEIRKTAFECMYTLLDTSIDKIDIPAFIAAIADGLKDTQYDIKLLCHLMIVRLSQSNGPALLEGLISLIEPLRLTLVQKVGDTAVKQQVERNEECVRSALRAIAAISRIPNSESVAKFEEFIKTSIKSGALASQYSAILSEDTTSHNTDAMDTSN
ncbi:HEAT repeat-containing protein [Tieghemostelium lacteum]|uniref:HEAT repeat-containing protein n=1 Tax=Tieghemostelium lacteum TaxID=361077 RepID=A0A152A3W0_TIELA|nr:HEAT repeat-containing protein [Tieghemostelium lacteum]|eukprot:KYR00775.1 HEAT repeat-containing protein [Tieghemostelium lacteum]